MKVAGKMQGDAEPSKRLDADGGGEVLHDYFETREGGGRLSLTLGTHLGWPVVGGFVADELPLEQEWPWAKVRGLGVRRGFRPRQSLSLARAWSRYRSEARVIVYSGTYAPIAVVNNPDARNILYCHTPPRFIYDQRSFYLNALPFWQRPVFAALVRYLKPRYERSVSRMDRIVVNSENVRRRVSQYLRRDSSVVYPPCDVARFRWREPKGYFLSTARLDPLKRVELVIEAFKEMPGERLIVASGGQERSRLQALAEEAPNIEFRGEVSDEGLELLIAECIATIYMPRDEDFGISSVESMAAGKPVIGVAEGGLLETIVHGETGLLLPPNPGAGDLIEAVSALSPQRARGMREACEARSAMFSTERFLEGMGDVIRG